MAMNPNQETVSHPGIVESVDDMHVKVRIASAAACGSCTVKSACGMSEMEDKVLEVTRENGRDFEIGSQVTVYMKQTLGSLAVVLGYILPFVVVLLGLIIGLGLGLSEGLAGLLSIGVLVPYYLVLYLSRNRLKKTFRFYIR